MADPTLEYTIPFQLTKTIRRDPYDAISTGREELSADGKVIVITGGGSGIGAAAAEVWARAGAEALAVRTDILKDTDVANLFVQTIKTFGRSPDVVLSNAGVVETIKIGEHEVDDWWNIMGINLKGVYATAHHFIKTQQDPKNPTGTFINTNSGLAGVIAPGLSAYSISKLAAQRLVEYLNTEYPSLRSFTLFPGIVLTDMLVGQFEKYGKDHPDLTGMLCLYLSSPLATYVNEGGLRLRPRV